MSKDLTSPITMDELRPILEHLAKAAHYSERAWVHLEASLPIVREVCPEFYTQLTVLLAKAYKRAVELEGLGDFIVDELDMAPQIDAAKGTRPLIGMQ
jgi:hypothetical protein